MAVRSNRYSIHEVKTHLSRLLDQVEKGEDVVICRAGTPVAVIKAYVSAEERHGGQWEGLVRIGEDFDEPLPPEVEQALLGDSG